MEIRKKIFYASIIGYMLIFCTYMFVAMNPEIILGGKVHTTKEMDPPGNLNVSLDSTHQYVVEIKITYGSSGYDIEFELKLDNSTFETITFSGVPEASRSGISEKQCFIPIDEESIGEFEIIVKNTSNVESVKYTIFIDPPKAYLIFYNYFVYLIPIGFIIMMLVVGINTFLNYKKNQ